VPDKEHQASSGSCPSCMRGVWTLLVIAYTETWGPRVKRCLPLLLVGNHTISGQVINLHVTGVHALNPRACTDPRQAPSAQVEGPLQGSVPEFLAAISTSQPPVSCTADISLHSPPLLHQPTPSFRCLTMSKIELAEVRITPVVDDDKAYGRDVPIKYRGTETDRLDMSMLGKTQVLRRQFKFWTMLGFASTVMVAWEFCLLVSPFSLEDGGTPGRLLGLDHMSIYHDAHVCQPGGGLVDVSDLAVHLSDMQSRSLTVSSSKGPQRREVGDDLDTPELGRNDIDIVVGQYHWVSELAPPRFQKVLSYAVGMGVQSEGLPPNVPADEYRVADRDGLANVSLRHLFRVGMLHQEPLSYFLSFPLRYLQLVPQPFTDDTEQASLILGLATLNFPEYQIQSWHQTLLTIAIVASCTFFNIFLAVRLPLVEALILVLHVAGVFAVIIPLWVMAPRGNAYDTILNFTNSGGW